MATRRLTQKQRTRRPTLRAVGARRASFGGFLGINVDVKVPWVGNAVKAAGKAVGGVMKGIADETGRIGRAIGKVPVIGGALEGIYHVALIAFVPGGAVFFASEQVLVEGKRIDKVALGAIKTAVKDFHEVAPYAQMVISLVPGVGPGVSAAIGCGLALADGQPLSQALMTGVEDALPGGPLAKMACDVAKEGINSAIHGTKITWDAIAKEGISAAATAIALPEEAKRALESGLTCASKLMHGERIDRALVAGFAQELSLSPQAKDALGALTDISVSLAQGQRLDKTLVAHVSSLASVVSVIPDDVKRSFTSLGSKLTGSALSLSLQHTVADVFLDVGKTKLPDAAKKALSIGMAVTHAQNLQSIVSPLLTGDVTRKLMAEGQVLIKTDPVVAAAYRSVVTTGHVGFQVGAALMRHTLDTHQFLTVRQGLSQEDKSGFDLATSLHIGRVTTPPSTKLADPHAQAGYAITHGAQGALPSQKQAIMQAVASSALPRVGATVAVNKISHERSSWWHRLLVALGLVDERKVA
jgi:hypothetical protein